MTLEFRLFEWRVRDLLRSLYHMAGKDPITALEEEIAEKTEGRRIVVTNLGRTALVLGLRSLGIREGTGVIVPAITCATVIRSVIRAGFRPIIVDVGRNLHLDTSLIRSNELEGASAIIVPHLYGMSAPIADLADWASHRGLRLVDDAAQAAGIRVHGKMLGTFGDIGILSFGPSKSVACTRGGALIAMRDAPVPPVRDIISEAESTSGAAARVLGGMLKLFSKRYRTRGARRKAAGTSAGETPGYMDDPLAWLHPLEAAIVKTVLDRVDAIISERRKSAEILHRVISKCPAVEPVCPTGAPLTKIPLRLTGKMDAGAAVERLRSMKIEAAHIYRPLHLYRSYAGYTRQQLNGSEECWRRVFLIPNPPRPAPSLQSRLQVALEALG